MLGAIIGDINGSIYEGHNHRWKAFELFTKKMHFTDDTVMTGAVAYSIFNNRGRDIVKDLRDYGASFPHRGYGGSFRAWLNSDKPKPYNSYGNGAAMRISSVAWFALDEEEVKELAWRVTSCTHDHPEGLKGAEVTAMCIFKALHTKDKEKIREYACAQYPEIATMNYMDLVKNYHFDVSCQGSVPQAIYCFLISKNFEDCLRTTVSIGGDTDTLCAISCAIAEAYYGIPKQYKKEVLKYFTDGDKRRILLPINAIYEKYGLKDYIKL